MKKLKFLYIFITILFVSLFASLAVLGSLLSNNIGKDANTVSIILPSVLFNGEEDNLDEWDYVSEMTLFGSNYGNNRDKVIAPGMSNSIKIKVENRNSGVLDYEIIFHFSSSEDDFWLPLKFKITRYDDTKLTNDYVAVETLDGLTDTHSVAGSRYSYYLVEWYWPYGENDTELGDLVLDKDIKIFASVEVKTWKSENQASLDGVLIKYQQHPVWEVINFIVAILIIVSAYAICSTLYNLSMAYYQSGGGFLSPGSFGGITSNKRKPKTYRGIGVGRTPLYSSYSGFRKGKKSKKKIGVKDE